MVKRRSPTTWDAMTRSGKGEAGVMLCSCIFIGRIQQAIQARDTTEDPVLLKWRNQQITDLTNDLERRAVADDNDDE